MELNRYFENAAVETDGFEIGIESELLNISEDLVSYNNSLEALGSVEKMVREYKVTGTTKEDLKVSIENLNTSVKSFGIPALSLSLEDDSEYNLELALEEKEGLLARIAKAIKEVIKNIVKTLKTWYQKILIFFNKFSPIAKTSLKTLQALPGDNTVDFGSFMEKITLFETFAVVHSFKDRLSVDVGFGKTTINDLTDLSKDFITISKDIYGFVKFTETGIKFDYSTKTNYLKWYKGTELKQANFMNFNLVDLKDRKFLPVSASNPVSFIAVNTETNEVTMESVEVEVPTAIGGQLLVTKAGMINFLEYNIELANSMSGIHKRIEDKLSEIESVMDKIESNKVDGSKIDLPALPSPSKEANTDDATFGDERVKVFANMMKEHVSLISKYEYKFVSGILEFNKKSLAFANNFTAAYKKRFG